MLFRLTYTDDIPEGFAGTAKFWFVKIRPEYKEDVGLLEHEKEHVRQFYKFSLFHCLAYGRLDRYTLWCEVRAYRKQLRYPPATQGQERYRDLYAGYLSAKYGLDLSKEEAKELLM